jgi:1,4-alpha-glucan branching enzyme
MNLSSTLKLTTVAVGLSLLVGCASIKEKVANFYMSRWDAHESALIAQVTVQAYDVVKVCDPKTAKEQQLQVIGQLQRTSVELLAYSRTLPDDNSPVIKVVKNITDSTDELYKRAQDKMSRVYCENKATNIRTMGEQAQQVVQAKRK